MGRPKIILNVWKLSPKFFLQIFKTDGLFKVFDKVVTKDDELLLLEFVKEVVKEFDSSTYNPAHSNAERRCGSLLVEGGAALADSD